MPSAERAPALRHAVALGLVQGPTELLPVSSSAHTELLPWLARWPYARLAGERRKSFEVALHAGAAIALTIHMRGEILDQAARVDRRRAGAIALAQAPPAIAGYALEQTIERRVGGPRSIAAGLFAGALAMALAERRGMERAAEDVGARDGLALGLAQAAALIPGVSRNGATLATARARGFSRAGAQALSWHAGLPVLLGAGVLKVERLRRAGLAPGERAALAAGATSALVSTLVSARLLDRRLREGQSLAPYALYRCALAAFVLMRTRRLARGAQ